MANQAEPVGRVTWSWDGKDDTGAYVPDGAYFMRVTAMTAQGSYSQEVRVYVAPFKITTSSWTATAGQSIKMTILTAEPQASWPKMTVTQPGVPKYSVNLRMYSSTKFTATITFKSGGTPGPVTIKIIGTDTRGGVDTRSYTATIQ
jgi:hypothetical protein